MRSRKLRPKPNMPPEPSRPAATDARTPSPEVLASPEADSPETRAPLKASGLQQMGSAIGGIIAGVENQVFGRPPPGPVLVRHATPSRGKGPDGTEFLLDFPEGTDAPAAPQAKPKGSRKRG